MPSCTTRTLMPRAGAAAAAAVISAVLAAGRVAAQDAPDQHLGNVASRLSGFGGSAASLEVVIAVVGGLVMLVLSMVKFAQRSSNPNNTIAAPIALFVTGVLMIALPMYADTSVVSTFGNGAERVNFSEALGGSVSEF